MIYTNWNEIAVSPLRKQALEIAGAAYEAIDTKKAIRRQFLYDQSLNSLDVMGRKFHLDDFERVVCVGFGKVAFAAVEEIYAILGDKIKCGYVIDLKEGKIGNLVCRVGTHPQPTVVNVQATEELAQMLDDCGEKDLVICVVSGGGSALLCRPHEMSCEQENEIIMSLTAKGANISELNTVRKHISKVKGGQLAKIIFPATSLNLIFSDVPGDDSSVVASGPTVKDGTSVDDAREILKKYRIGSEYSLLETPKDDRYFEKVTNLPFMSAGAALSAMKAKAEELGYEAEVFSENFQGESSKLGPEIVMRNQKENECLLGAGESTVQLTGNGKGGRNMHMALSALSYIGKDQVLLALASDGMDNTDAAGAIIDQQVVEKSSKLNPDPEKYLSNCDSYNFFKTTGDLVFTGSTDANVSDFFVCLKNSKA